jgi:hypothetical protein
MDPPYHSATMLRLLRIFLLLPLGAAAQGTGVPIYEEAGRGPQGQEVLMEQAKKLMEAGALLPFEQLKEQMKRTECGLTLPPAKTQPLSDRERWQLARQSHLRIGYYFLCTKCDKRHLNLAGGYVITADGAVATCAHVVALPDNMKEGHLIAVTDDDVVYPVTEILAVDPARDSAIIRVKAEALTPLPLATEVIPGDPVWCFSDPSAKRGYYSEGIVSRFSKRPFIRKKEAPLPAKEAMAAAPVWLETTLDWAPGSSGSALLDSFGNCVGHVSQIEPLQAPQPAGPRPSGTTTVKPPGTFMVIHQAIAAAEVRAMVKAK